MVARYSKYILQDTQRHPCNITKTTNNLNVIRIQHLSKGQQPATKILSTDVTIP